MTFFGHTILWLFCHFLSTYSTMTVLQPFFTAYYDFFCDKYQPQNFIMITWQCWVLKDNTLFFQSYKGNNGSCNRPQQLWRRSSWRWGDEFFQFTFSSLCLSFPLIFCSSNYSHWHFLHLYTNCIFMYVKHGKGWMWKYKTVILGIDNLMRSDFSLWLWCF